MLINMFLMDSTVKLPSISTMLPDASAPVFGQFPANIPFQVSTSLSIAWNSLIISFSSPIYPFSHFLATDLTGPVDSQSNQFWPQTPTFHLGQSELPIPIKAGRGRQGPVTRAMERLSEVGSLVLKISQKPMYGLCLMLSPRLESCG